MEAQPMGSPASSLSSSRGGNTRTVLLMDGGMDGCGVLQHMTMTRRKSGVSVRVSLQFRILTFLTFLNQNSAAVVYLLKGFAEY